MAIANNSFQGIITLTKQPSRHSKSASPQGDGAPAEGLRSKVAHMLAAWETSDELAGEFAGRLLEFIDTERGDHNFCQSPNSR
jgi:hypothetical protein